MPIVQRSGTGAGGSVLFLHGTPGDHRFFQKLAGQAPDRLLVAEVDLPDHGAAPDQPDLTLTAFDRDVDACLLGLPSPITVVGHSFGGYLTVRLLGRAAGRIARAVFVSAFASLPAEVSAGRTQLADAVESGQLTAPAAEQLAVDLFLAGEGQPDDEALIRAMMRDTPGDRLLRTLRRVAGVPAQPPLPSFATPAVVLHALDDQALPHSLSVELAALGTQARLVSLPGRSHCLAMTALNQVASAVF